MSTNTCCHVARPGRVPARRPWLALAEWAIPGAVLTFLPKCPACLAAYVALWTGVGMSFTTATYVRLALVALSLAAIGYLVLRFLAHRVAAARRS